MSETYEEFEKRMEAKYPKMFVRPYGGFAIGEGWWKIIEVLCDQIQSHINWRQEQKEKYQRGDGCQQVVVHQIKEKFGGLRFYYDGGDDYIHGMLAMAESWAACTCEVCGERGSLRHGGWIRTLCDKHEEEHQNKRAQYDAE